MLAVMLRNVCSRVVCACPAGPALELRPVHEVELGLPAEPSRDPGRQPAQRHRLLGHHVEAVPDHGRPGQRPLEGLRHVVGVHVVQDAQPVIGQGQWLTTAASRPTPPADLRLFQWTRQTARRARRRSLLKR